MIRERIRIKNKSVYLIIKNFDKNKIAIIDIFSFYNDLIDDVKNNLFKLSKNNLYSVIIDL